MKIETQPIHHPSLARRDGGAIKPTLGLRLRLLPWALILAAACPATAQVIDIPDPVLRAAISDHLGKPPAELTVADMERLTELDASNDTYYSRHQQYHDPITSLEGLQAATNLERLELRGVPPHMYLSGESGWDCLSRDIDMEPLLHLPALSSLGLGGNQLASLTLPNGLAKLAYLDVRFNGMQSLSIPDGLTSLTDTQLRDGNQLPLPKISGFTVNSRTPTAAAARVEWIAIPGVHYRIEVSNDCVDWVGIVDEGENWIESLGEWRFVPQRHEAHLDFKFPGEWAKGVVRVREVGQIIYSYRDFGPSPSPCF